MTRNSAALAGGGLILAGIGVGAYLLYRRGQGLVVSESTVTITPSNPVGEATVSWAAVRGATHYEMRHVTASGSPTTIPMLANGRSVVQLSVATPSVQLTDSTDTSGAYNPGTYHIQIRACGILGCGPWTPVIAVTFAGS